MPYVIINNRVVHTSCHIPNFNVPITNAPYQIPEFDTYFKPILERIAKRKQQQKEDDERKARS